MSFTCVPLCEGFYSTATLPFTKRAACATWRRRRRRRWRPGHLGSPGGGARDVAAAMAHRQRLRSGHLHVRLRCCSAHFRLPRQASCPRRSRRIHTRTARPRVPASSVAASTKQQRPLVPAAAAAALVKAMGPYIGGEQGRLRAAGMDAGAREARHCLSVNQIYGRAEYLRKWHVLSLLSSLSCFNHVYFVVLVPYTKGNDM